MSAWEYWNAEYHTHSLKYQIVCSLGCPHVIHVAGPFKGASADITIARKYLVPLLDPGEKVLADRAYHKDTHFWTPPKGPHLDAREKATKKRIHAVRATVERLICRVKKFGCLRTVWPYSWRLHKQCVTVVCQLTNLQLLDEPLN